MSATTVDRDGEDNSIKQDEREEAHLCADSSLANREREREN